MIFQAVNSVLAELDAAGSAKHGNAYTFYKFFNDRVNSLPGFNQFLEIQGEFCISSPKFEGTILRYMDLTGKCPKISANALAKALRRELT